MIDQFQRNGARAWLLRILLAHVVGVVLIAVLAGVSPGAVRQLGATVAGMTPLGYVLNAGILVAVAAGSLLVLAWLLRASREEAAVNRFWTDNFAAREEGSSPRPTSRRLRLENLGRSAMRERVELVEHLQLTGARLDAGALSESLLDREEPRVAIARYAAGTLVLLGLLGTFVGLLVTIGGVSDVVEGLVVSPDADLEAFLVQLKEGLRSPLQGMSIAFSTSLIGLAGSLLVGVGALGLSAAQSSWIGKLEHVTAVHLHPTPGWQGAAPVVAGTAAAPAAGGADLARLEAAARVLRDSQSAVASHLEHFDATGTRMAGTLEDFRDRVAGLAGQTERVEALLARVADAQGLGREAVNDLGAKLSELHSGVAAMRSDVRDGREELSQQLGGAGRSLLDALSGGLSELSVAVREAGTADLAVQVEALRRTLVETQASRGEEARRTHELLGRLVRGVDASGAGSPPGVPASGSEAPPPPESEPPRGPRLSPPEGAP